jgi:hypothetical protein
MLQPDVDEVEQLLRSSIRTIERRQQAIPLEFASAATKVPYVDSERIAELSGYRGKPGSAPSRFGYAASYTSPTRRTVTTRWQC